MGRGTRWLVYGGLAAGGAALLGRQAHRAGHHLLQRHNELFVGAGSRRYRRLAPWLVGGLYRAVAAETVAHLSQGTVVDVGCGPGLLAVELGRRAPALTVIGVDISADMVEQAREVAARAGLGPQVRFEAADGAALPFADGSVDLVVSTLSMHHWERVAAVLAELARVARPGGQVRIYDVWRPALLEAAKGLPFTLQTAPFPARVGPLSLPGFTRYTLTRS
jgi:ubiquinone/menaquinone biosynthesis C-methylase UbiE